MYAGPCLLVKFCWPGVLKGAGLGRGLWGIDILGLGGGGNHLLGLGG